MALLIIPTAVRALISSEVYAFVLPQEAERIVRNTTSVRRRTISAVSGVYTTDPREGAEPYNMYSENGRVTAFGYV